jgi:hypothetical protein
LVLGAEIARVEQALAVASLTGPALRLARGRELQGGKPTCRKCSASCGSKSGSQLGMSSAISGKSLQFVTIDLSQPDR